jgi:hypothetical protein
MISSGKLRWNGGFNLIGIREHISSRRTGKAAYNAPDFSVPTWCGTMKINAAFSVRNEISSAVQTIRLTQYLVAGINNVPYSHGTLVMSGYSYSS